MAARLRRDAELLGLDGRTEIVEAALELLHRRAAQERTARGVDEFHGNGQPPLPIGVALPPVRPMPRPEAFRGEVRDVDFPDVGTHPAVVLSVDPMDVRLGHIAVIPVTGTQGPEQTHVPRGTDAGPTGYDESYADVTGLQPVARERLLARRGLLSLREPERLGRQLTVYRGL
jgi:mRNA interferase MazF